AGALDRHAVHRHRQSGPRGGKGEARRRAFRHRRRPHLRRHVRARHRLPRGRRLPAGSDLLRQSARRKRLRPDRLRGRGCRRHGLGGGRAARRAVRRRGREPVRSLPRRVARPGRHFPDVHSRVAAAAAGPVRGAGMKRMVAILIPVALLAAVPAVTTSNVVLNFLVTALLIALVGQGWNLLGGYGGQYSFGHAACFGTGAYVPAVLQVRYGINAWVGFGAAIAGGAAVGTVIGALTFRSGLRGSYFALVTLAFAEVLRILASVAPITG